MAYSVAILETQPNRLVTVARLAANIGCTPAAVRYQIGKHDVPRRSASGWEDEGGRYIYVGDYLGREVRRYATDRTCRRRLRTAGALPPASRGDSR